MKKNGINLVITTTTTTTTTNLTRKVQHNVALGRESHSPFMYATATTFSAWMIRGKKSNWDFLWKFHSVGALNDKPITIPFVFHFSCVKFYVLASHYQYTLPFSQITNPMEEESRGKKIQRTKTTASLFLHRLYPELATATTVGEKAEIRKEKWI